MKISRALLRQIEADLGLNLAFVKGQDIPIRNCWHFSTDGNTVELMFYGDADFIAGMNRIYIVLQKYNIVILAFCLMDTHVHFVLYGTFEECNKFVHDYVNRTSQYISFNHKERKKLGNVVISHQLIDTDYYLKTVICYVIKNPVAAGMPFMAYDYPWSSGPLYFRQLNLWTSMIGHSSKASAAMGSKAMQNQFQTNLDLPNDIEIVDGIIYPEEYTALSIVERIYRSTKGFSFFLDKNKESEVESRGGQISHLSIPIQEMRQNKAELCFQMFGVRTVKNLNTQQRLKLAKALKTKYNSSVKQLTRICGLVYEEVKTMF